MGRGRKITVGESSVILYARHNASCEQHDDNSGTVTCKCIRWMQMRDGSRESTSEWTWTKAEAKAKKKLGAAVESEEGEAKSYPVKKAVEEWLAEREHDKLRSTKAEFIANKLLDWCKRQGIENLQQIEKQALRVWRTEEWKYAHITSTSLKVHWSILRTFFSWCVDGDLLEANCCPKPKGRIKPTEVVPLKPHQIDALLAAVERMSTPGWTHERKLKMQAIILLQRWAGLAIVDASKLLRSELVGFVIDSKRHKTDKAFSVPIPKWVADLLQAVPNNDPRYFFWHKRNDKLIGFPENIVGGWYQEVFEEAGIDGHSHQLRHSFATHHLELGVPIARVSEWMGDNEAEVRRTYAHWTQKRGEMSLAAMQDSWKLQGLDEQGNPLSKSHGASSSVQ